ncbi:hypothetical protein ASE21_15170 [Flavobacterium sp. Root901]|uniref:gliding motility-associated C-terminal domain-containing protein n=1 Tax=Flavobacterium sp. Root901 TaxID=1736605 RepID=UPI00070F7EFB|nr:gliding motility-associated C-terminal domain-containing protein [Flavobacterium sp. Root901]KRD09180.1 hypothetical protein ASE21_15170 [Flavobacterium sp. Root901]
MIKICIKATILSFFSTLGTSGQTVNVGDLAVMSNTKFSTVSDFVNKKSGNFSNDGSFLVYSNFLNDGLVTYSNSSNGKTLFIGSKKQLIDGQSLTHFQDVLFDNLSESSPFDLNNIIVIGNSVEFKRGIVNAKGLDSAIIFDQQATHSGAGDLSFVDGKTEKKGTSVFEFPVGDKNFYRPLYTGSGSDANTVLTTQYFFESADSLYPFTNKDDSILAINDAEYWKVTQDKGTGKTILSLTLDKDTTPASFLEKSDQKELAILRWDSTLLKWINEKGTVEEDSLQGGNYSKLITASVAGYGIFTTGFVKKAPSIIDEDLIIYNALSPNGDGINDSFHIKGINKYPDNNVQIYNRWGVKVFEADKYNENDIMFRGYSDGHDTFKRSQGLPAGTYFYILKYSKGTAVVEKSGYLYISSK